MLSYHASMTLPNQPPAYEQVTCSFARAEQLLPAALQQQLEAMEGSTRMSLRLRRAWTKWEYALSTPEHEGDGMYFTAARGELAAVAGQPGASLRNRRCFEAFHMLAQEEAFMARAAHAPVTPDLLVRTRDNIGWLLGAYIMDGPPPSPTEYGKVAELMAAYSLLYDDKMPYLGSHREERNEGTHDNHDYYLLEPDVPISVKHFAREEKADKTRIVTLRMGAIAHTAARTTQPYNRDPNITKVRGAATDLLAGIMVRNSFLNICRPEPNELLRPLPLPDSERQLLDNAARLVTERINEFAGLSEDDHLERALQRLRARAHTLGQTKGKQRRQ